MSNNIKYIQLVLNIKPSTCGVSKTTWSEDIRFWQDKNLLKNENVFYSSISSELSQTSKYWTEHVFLFKNTSWNVIIKHISILSVTALNLRVYSDFHLFKKKNNLA